MTYEFVISTEAKQDIENAYAWYELRKDGLGYVFESNLEKAIESIKENPFAYQIKYDQVRVCFVSQFPFGLHYFIDGEMVRLVAVFHASRDPQKWFNRL
ncbi:MAG: type II toxin-antitoxin system RelE/ParE family toxin [Bacteroidetes bacterium]|nr:type II toxin-antitoxin system RelE/ParE family toxin [Bacteroidota bacterium]MBS1540277.1 type II toxin-antitoxin system RelE/ParE family toxin [Bacteroidota bacterium]